MEKITSFREPTSNKKTRKEWNQYSTKKEKRNIIPYTYLGFTFKNIIKTIGISLQREWERVVRTFRVREISGAGKSVKHVWGWPQVGALTGKHLHRGIDLRSYDIESTWRDENSGAGVPGVAGADTGGVPASDSGISSSSSSSSSSFCFSTFEFKNNK